MSRLARTSRISSKSKLANTTAGWLSPASATTAPVGPATKEQPQKVALTKGRAACF
jgi:hypothetical protein